MKNLHQILKDINIFIQIEEELRLKSSEYAFQKQYLFQLEFILLQKIEYKISSENIEEAKNRLHQQSIKVEGIKKNLTEQINESANRFKNLFRDFTAYMTPNTFLSFLLNHKSLIKKYLEKDHFFGYESFDNLYRKELNEISDFLLYTEELFSKGIYTQGNEKLAREIIFDFEPSLQIDTKLLPNIPKAKNKTVLDLIQTALVFYFFMNNKIIYKLPDSTIAPVIASITPHSEQNLRTKALAMIEGIRKGKSEYYTNYNYIDKFSQLKDIIDNISNNIQSDIDLMNKK